MSVGEIGLYCPVLTHLPTFLPCNNKFKIQLFNPNPDSTTFSSQFLTRRRKFLFKERRGLIRALNTMDWEREDNDKGEPELDGVLEQEEQNLLFDASSSVRNDLQHNINRLSKWLVAAIFTATILWRHDAEALWAAMGSVLNSALSVVLKQILNQERPNSAISSGPGMPSSHAQSIFYTVVFLTWSLIEWLGVNELALVLSTLVLACGSYFSWLRVSQEYHTKSQVVVGGAVGSAFATLWLWSWQAFVISAFDSSMWVRIVVIVASVIACLCFLVHVVRHWLRDVQ